MNNTIHQFRVKNAQNKEVDLADYKGKVVLVVILCGVKRTGGGDLGDNGRAVNLCLFKCFYHGVCSVMLGFI